MQDDLIDADQSKVYFILITSFKRSSCFLEMQAFRNWRREEEANVLEKITHLFLYSKTTC